MKLRILRHIPKGEPHGAVEGAVLEALSINGGVAWVAVTPDGPFLRLEPGDWRKETDEQGDNHDEDSDRPGGLA